MLMQIADDDNDFVEGSLGTASKFCHFYFCMTHTKEDSEKFCTARE